jgi:hypothetical protein
LGESESPSAIALLSRIRDLDSDGRIRRNALSLIDALQTAGTTPESVSNLKSAYEKLEEEHRKLRAVVEEIKAEQTKHQTLQQ